VVDDCADEATILCDGLQLNDYEAVAAHSGSDALRICREQTIDLLLLDVGLPDIDGYEVCRQLKADESTREILVIFVTARGAQEEVSRGLELGAVDYICKPYNLPIVMVRVDSALRSQTVDQLLHFDSAVLHDSAYTDHLTGLRNRRFLLERLTEEAEKAHRYNYPLTCMLVDVDELQAMDSDMGAAALDDLLVEIAMAMRSSSRSYDILARFEGGTFAAVLPHAMAEDALAYARKIEEEIGDATLSDPCFPTRTRLRFGIVTCRNGSTPAPDALLGEAMRRLFQAKSQEDESICYRDLSDGSPATN
jgi:diguanylate cyclase (GGDEF)-like protein